MTFLLHCPTEGDTCTFESHSNLLERPTIDFSAYDNVPQENAVSFSKPPLYLYLEPTADQNMTVPEE